MKIEISNNDLMIVEKALHLLPYGEVAGTISRITAAINNALIDEVPKDKGE